MGVFEGRGQPTREKADPPAGRAEGGLTRGPPDLYCRRRWELARKDLSEVRKRDQPLTRPYPPP